MAIFQYSAFDDEGMLHYGEIEAGAPDEVQGLLRDRGLILSMIEEPNPVRSPELSQSDLAELVEQLASLTKAGLPLGSGLRAAAREMESKSLRSTLEDLADRIDAGSDLDEALSACRGSFPPHIRGLILAGTRSGRLAELLGEYVRTANLAAELRRLFWSTLAYPVVSLIASIAIVYFVCTLSVKAVDSLISSLNEYGQKPPPGVEGLISLARAISEHGPEILLGLIAVPILAWATLRFGSSPARRRRIVCSIPVVGPILRFASLSEFCHLLAMLIEANLPLPLAFELAGSSVRDADVAEACGRMGRAVEGGEALSGAVRLWDSIPAGLGQLFQWSEDRQSLPESLHLAGDMFESRARRQSNFAGSVLAVLLMLLIIWWVGFAIASLYLPLISLISRLSG